MGKKITASIEEYFSEVDDPRVERTKLHKLTDIIVIAMCAVICGADKWEDVEFFGKAKQKWLKTFLELPNGIPSAFIQWMQAVSTVITGEVIAIDGKVLRRSHDCGVGKAAIDMVSAWVSIFGR